MSENFYKNAMDRCTPPDGLEERLYQKLSQAAEQQTGSRPKRVIRPRSFGKKLLLAAALTALVLTSTGAALVFGWDAVFSQRFGNSDPALVEDSFQKVYITSVCNDVTLTIREALCQDNTLYLILDYRLPDEMASVIAQHPDADLSLPMIEYYGTDSITWPQIREAEQTRWQEIDWTDHASYFPYLSSFSPLSPYRFSDSAGGMEEKGYDAQTNTVTYLCHITISSDSKNFSDTPITVLSAPPILDTGSERIAVADHPAIVTFHPTFISNTLTGTVSTPGLTLTASVSPFALTLRAVGGQFESSENLYSRTSLEFENGVLVPVSGLSQGCSGGSSKPSGSPYCSSADFDIHFEHIQDITQIKAVRVDEQVIELKPARS